ncbi:MAG: SpoIID/LytB domain-containing protein [Ignavibacteriaceae bacterium]|nr:SpoIID/LytB domain-containing protein [Ignavibacteriaceae bacterium]
MIFSFFSCTPSERFTKKEKTNFNASEIRVLLNDFSASESLNIESPVFLNDETNILTQIHAGSKVDCFVNNSRVIITVNGKNYTREKFILSSADDEAIININGKRYRGKIQVSSSNNSIDLINIVNLENYVKGVLSREMPLGKTDENYEALKALAVCVRTYSIRKTQDGKLYFDLFDDTHDQVYGGVDAENPLSNKAADETKNLILKYENEPALLYYHSTCGGYTESSENVFTRNPVPYLITIKDGDDPYCKISPRFQWEEVYTRDEIVTRLKNYSLLDNANYELEDIFIVNKFESGRVSELKIKVVNDKGEQKSLLLRGNEIRSILRTSDNKNILWSTMFDLSTNSNSIVLKGKGFGHGVGLCEWGAIVLSRKGWKYKDILQHYYPGTNVEKYND